MSFPVPSCEWYCQAAAQVAGVFEATAPWGFVALVVICISCIHRSTR